MNRMIARATSFVYTNSIHGGANMLVKVREVGNSLTVTIPKNIAADNNIEKNDTMMITAVNGALVFEKKSNAKSKLEKYLEKYYNQPINKIGIVNENDTETDWGKDVGGETLT